MTNEMNADTGTFVICASADFELKPQIIAREPDDSVFEKAMEEAPFTDSLVQPVMTLLDQHLSTSEAEPPMRDVMGRPTEVRERMPNGPLYTLTSQNDRDKRIRIKTPSMPLLSQHDDTSMLLLIERHIKFIRTNASNRTIRRVSLNPVFVRHFLKYRDSKLPVVQSVATMPIVLPNGELLSKNGLDRERRIVFRIDPALREIMPDRSTITDDDIRAATEFLFDEWLIDVECDIEGKCIIVAMALSVLERALLDERPVFFIGASKRGGGKTTALNMVSLATTGHKAPATAWSCEENERRKAMLAVLAQAVPVLIWDNIEAGSALSSPTLEKVLTSPAYSDRQLGETKYLTVPTATIMGFSGNNIAPAGDLSSRSLIANIRVERPDPENRSFVHPFPFDWTLAHRGEILQAFYTILLGNPQLGRPLPADQETTRMKIWWILIGSAIEHASGLLQDENGNPLVEGIDKKGRCITGIQFSKLFEKSEAEDDSSIVILDMLKTLGKLYPNGKKFKSADISARIGSDSTGRDELAKSLYNYFSIDVNGKAYNSITPITVGLKLHPIIGAPYYNDDNSIIKLVKVYNKGKKTNEFSVEGVTSLSPDDYSSEF